MTKEELAEKLDGNEYGDIVPEYLHCAAKEEGLVIVYGASDDLVEFQGAIDDEVAAYNGGTVYLNRFGLLINRCKDDLCPYFKQIQDEAERIEAVWSDTGKPCWTFETTIPHETLRVMEGGEVFCIGIVFSMKDLK